MSEQNLRRAAHAVMLAAFDGTEPPAWLADAFADGLAGVCLYGANVPADGDLTRVGRAVRALDPTAVVAADEEGGDVTRLHMASGSPHPGSAALGAFDDLATTRTVAAGIGAELAAAGIWFDLAPCADVNSNPGNPVIGTRSFGPDAELVAGHTVAFVEGLASQGVAAAVKHFAGHGDTSADSHLELPRVTAPADVLRSRELVPFVAAVRAGVPAIMTSHVVVEAVDPDAPATLSPAVLTGLLRGELGYDGVIVSDALDMAGASARHGIGGAAVLALGAGADLLCLGPEPTTEPSVLALAVDAVLTAVADGRLEAQRLLEAASRVDALRARWSGLTVEAGDDAVAKAGEASREVARAVVQTHGLTPRPGAAVVRIDTGTNPAVGQTAWGELDLGGERIDLTAASLATTEPIGGDVVLVVRRAAAHPEVWAWIQRQLAANDRTILVELAWPEPAIADHPRVVTTWGSATVLTDELARRWGGAS